MSNKCKLDIYVIRYGIHSIHIKIHTSTLTLDKTVWLVISFCYYSIVSSFSLRRVCVCVFYLCDCCCCRQFVCSVVLSPLHQKLYRNFEIDSTNQLFGLFTVSCSHTHTQTRSILYFHTRTSTSIQLH